MFWVLKAWRGLVLALLSAQDRASCVNLLTVGDSSGWEEEFSRCEWMREKSFLWLKIFSGGCENTQRCRVRGYKLFHGQG